MVVLTVILEMGVVPVKESIAPIMAIVVRFFYVTMTLLWCACVSDN